LEASELILQTGSIHKETLGGLGSAGYIWSFAIGGPADVIAVSFETVEPPSGSLPSSYDCDYVFTLAALKPGKARIRFYLHRPWERGAPPVREVIMDVLVT